MLCRNLCSSKSSLNTCQCFMLSGMVLFMISTWYLIFGPMGDMKVLAAMDKESTF
jgi:hypothetical protein